MPTVFESARLIARHCEVSDAQAMVDLFGHPDVAKYLPGPRMDSLEHAHRIIGRNLERYARSNGTLGGFMVVEKASGAVVGSTLLKHMPDAHMIPTEDIEVGWHMMPECWGRGYASEIGRACITYGFRQLALPEIHAVVDPENERSLRVARRIGLEHRGRTDRYYGMNAEWFALERTRFLEGLGES
jgi:RimJ/RimL family protein N-acetyltransferase